MRIAFLTPHNSPHEEGAVDFFTDKETNSKEDTSSPRVTQLQVAELISPNTLI